MCDGEQTKSVTVGLRTSSSISSDSNDINSIIGLVGEFFNDMIEKPRGHPVLISFDHESAPLDFINYHPCWGCWLKKHLEILNRDNITVYSKENLCSSPHALIRFFFLAFTSFYFSTTEQTVELVCDDLEDVWTIAMYSEARKWYEKLEVCACDAVVKKEQ
jgi:hypothetical protein